MRSTPGIGRLTISDLTKVYGPRAAVRDFSLEVAGGEFISLLGPSGCGKTTALNCISGLLEPDRGRIELDGQDMTHVLPERRHFGMVFQSYALFPHMTVGQNVAFGLEMAHVPRSEISGRVDEALARVRLDRLNDRYPSQLSGGQQQRVALARALVTRPRILLMDEPLSNLDAKLRVEMRLEIRRLHQALGMTTIYVTHDQAEALSLSDRMVVMREGTVEQVGRPEEVYAQPGSAYVAGFIGYRNLLPVRVEGTSGDFVHVKAPGGIDLRGTARSPLAVGALATAAIRPEDVVIGLEGEPGMTATVELVEFLGEALEVSLDMGGELDLIARTAGRVAPGARVSVQVPPERLLVFDEHRSTR